MSTIKLPAFFASSSFWLAVLAGALTGVMLYRGDISASQAQATWVGTLAALKLALAGEGIAASNAAPDAPVLPAAPVVKP